jgi:hypothetical protein
MVQSVLPQNRLERNRSFLCRLGLCELRVSQIGRILGRFQAPQVICRDDRRDRLTVTFDDHPFATVFGATEQIRKSILGFSDGHGGHEAIMAYLASIDKISPRSRCFRCLTSIKP